LDAGDRRAVARAPREVLGHDHAQRLGEGAGLDALETVEKRARRVVDEVERNAFGQPSLERADPAHASVVEVELPGAHEERTRPRALDGGAHVLGARRSRLPRPEGDGDRFGRERRGPPRPRPDPDGGRGHEQERCRSDEHRPRVCAAPWPGGTGLRSVAGCGSYAGEGCGQPH
jgi:hypothetical protein